MASIYKSGSDGNAANHSSKSKQKKQRPSDLSHHTGNHNKIEMDDDLDVIKIGAWMNTKQQFEN